MLLKTSLASLVLLFAFSATAFAGCKDLKGMSAEITARNQKIQALNAQSAVDAPKICHQTFQLSLVYIKFKAAVESDAAHCGVPEQNFWNVESTNFESARMSCGASWK